VGVRHINRSRFATLLPKVYTGAKSELELEPPSSNRTAVRQQPDNNVTTTGPYEFDAAPTADYVSVRNRQWGTSLDSSAARRESRYRCVAYGP